MSRFKDEINKELGYLEFSGDANDIITMHNKSKYVFSAKKVVSLAAAFVLVFTMIFLPISSNNNSGFTIIANAKSASDDSTAGVELNTENFVELKSDNENLLVYNFNYVLDESAAPSDIAKKYLFHSFSKELDIMVEGEDIETITYKIHKGSLGCISLTNEDDHYYLSGRGATFGDDNSTFTVKYDEQKYLDYGFNPLENSDGRFYKNNYTLLNTGEITNETVVTNDPAYIVGSGYKDDDTLATKEEIETLRSYAKKDDMVGFYNYQNQIFKRLIDGITLDVTVTKTNGSTQTQTLEFLYTPNIIDTIERDDKTSPQSAYFDNMLTLSTGTVSARIKK